MAHEVNKEDRLLGALCYPFWPLAFLILNLSPVLRRNRFVRHHAFQGFFLGAGIWAGMIVLNTVTLLIGRFLWPLGLLMYPLMKILGLACLLVTAYCALRAWWGDAFPLPVVFDFARPFIEETPEAEAEAEATAPDPAPASGARDLVERIPGVEPAPVTSPLPEQQDSPKGRKGRSSRKSQGNGQAEADEPS